MASLDISRGDMEEILDLVCIQESELPYITIFNVDKAPTMLLLNSLFIMRVETIFSTSTPSFYEQLLYNKQQGFKKL